MKKNKGFKKHQIQQKKIEKLDEIISEIALSRVAASGDFDLLIAPVIPKDLNRKSSEKKLK